MKETQTFTILFNPLNLRNSWTFHNLLDVGAVSFNNGRVEFPQHRSMCQLAPIVNFQTNISQYVKGSSFFCRIRQKVQGISLSHH